MPGLAGCALIVFLLVVAIFTTPLEPGLPRDVCQQFERAWGNKDQSRMRQLTTKNMWDAIPEMAMLPIESGRNHFELLNEVGLPSDQGETYFVGLRYIFWYDNQRTELKGAFLLVQREGEWKIDNVLLISEDSQPIYFELSRDFQVLSFLREPGALPAQKSQDKTNSAFQACATTVANESVKYGTKNFLGWLVEKGGYQRVWLWLAGPAGILVILRRKIAHLWGKFWGKHRSETAIPLNAVSGPQAVPADNHTAVEKGLQRKP